MNFPVYGYDEALITYIVAASSTNTSDFKRVISENSWVKNPSWKNGKSYYGLYVAIRNFEIGGPLFFEQYTYMGIDPTRLKDDHGIDY